MACLSVDGFLNDPPGVDVCAAGVDGVKKPFTRFCNIGVPTGVCGVPVTFWLMERFNFVGELKKHISVVKGSYLGIHNNRDI